MPSYQTLLRNLLAEVDLQEQFKREIIVKMAQQLEREKYPTDMINERITEDVQPRISGAYVGKCLEDKYKNKSKIHKKKKEPIVIAADGTVIETDEAKLARQEAEINAVGHEEFSQALDRVAEAGSKEIQSLDQAVLKELDQVRDERKALQEQLNSAVDELQKLKQDKNYIFEYIEENLGYYMVFDRNEDNEIFVKEIDSERADTRKELKIDLRKFEDNIKDSYKRGKHIADLKHNGTQVTSWK